MKKRLFSLVMSLIMALSLGGVLPAMNVIATQSKTSSFDKSYTLTGNAQSDMIAIARAQVGRTQSQFGYTEAWCADFVSDCAKLSGQSTAIPANGLCYSLMKAVKEAGGYTVSKNQAKAGDLVFFSSSKYPDGGAHVELVYDYSNGILKSIGGNCNINGAWRVYDRVNGKSSSVSYYCVIRPNYKSSIPNTVVNLGNSFSAKIRNASSGKLVSNISDNIMLQAFGNDKLGTQIFKFLRNSDGSYTITTSTNGKALDLDDYRDSDGTNIHLWKNQGTSNQKWFILKNADETYSLRPSCSSTRVMDIKDGNIYADENIQLWSYNNSAAQKFYIDKCEEVVNLGEDFKSLILNTGHWKPILQQDNGQVVLGSEKSDNYNRTLWHFIRNANNGTYTIYSYLNGKCLDVKDAKDADETMVQCYGQNGSSAQQWYILRRDDGSLYLKAACSSRVLDLSWNNKDDDTPIIMFYNNNTEAQKFTIWKLQLPRDQITYNISSSKNTMELTESVNINIKNAQYAISYKLHIISPDNKEIVVDNKCNPVYQFKPDQIGKYIIYAEVKNPVSSYEGSETNKSVNVTVKCSHKYDSGKIAKQPTETATGVKTYTCTVCKAIKTEVIPKLSHSHSYTSKITKQPTCTATGIKTFTCSCGESYTETIAKKSHSYSTSWTIDKQATCTADGSKSYHCTACGTKKDVTTIAKTAHKYDSGKITKQPTETATGVKTYTCTVCKTTKTEAIPRLAHKHSYMSKITKQPTCTATGVKTLTCSCGDSYTETIAKKSHSYSTSWTIDKQATCTADGSKSYHCTACGTKKDVTTIAKTAHKYDSGKITKQPTETATGVKTYTCTVCKTTKTEAIPRLAHKHSYMSKITKQPTCTATGIKTFNCSCGDSYTETIAKTGHSYSTKVIVPTCTSQGYTLHTCSKCGSNYKNNYTDLKEHGYEHFIIEEPTCTDIGEELFICSYCGDSYTETISATGHKYTTTVVKPTYSAQGYTLHKCSTCGNSYKDTYTNKLVLNNVSGFKVSSTSTNSIKLTWNKVKGATGYTLYQQKNGKWTKVKSLTGTSYTVPKLKAGTTYKFAVKAYKKISNSLITSPSFPTVTTSTNPATVNLKLTAGSKKATVKWSKVSGATGYKVYYKTSKNGKLVGLKITNNKTTSYTKTGLKKGKTYYFTVKAYRTVAGKTYNGSYTTKSVKVK